MSFKMLDDLTILGRRGDSANYLSKVKWMPVGLTSILTSAKKINLTNIKRYKR